MAFGLLAVILFSITLPATRLAVGSLHPLVVGLGRELVAACLAAPLLYFTRQSMPTVPQLRGLCLVVLGVVIGFPTLTAWAMQRADASHGAVVLGLLPMATAIAGVFRAHERPPLSFWCASAFANGTVVSYAFASGGGKFSGADLALFGAVVCAALGYAEGGRRGREMGGWQVICWALVLGIPLLIPSVAWIVWQHGLAATPAAWAGFAYVSLVSAFLGFFAWYHGLAIGGIARVGQLQLLQPFFTLAFAALFLGEGFGLGAILCATLVTLTIFIGRRSEILHSKNPNTRLDENSPRTAGTYKYRQDTHAEKFVGKFPLWHTICNYRPNGSVLKSKIVANETTSKHTKSMSQKLINKIALVTGGTSGIGLATAHRFVAEGAYVFITGRRKAHLDEAVKQLGANHVTGIQADSSTLIDLDHLYAQIKEQKGHLDVLFVNAGGGELVPLGQITEEHFDKTFDTNVKGVVFTVQKALPLLSEGASIILNASTAGSKGGASFSIYSASKAAVRNLARSWSLDLKARHIRVNVVSPGVVPTPAYDGLGLTKEQLQGFVDSQVATIPLGRVGTTDEIAKAVVFLASDDSSFIDAIELFVDGGMTQV